MISSRLVHQPPELPEPEPDPPPLELPLALPLPPLLPVPLPVPEPPPIVLPPLVEPLPVPGLVLLPLASPPLPPPTEPGGKALPVVSVVDPASIWVEGGMPLLSTGALSEDWAKAAIELAERTPASATAVRFTFIMVNLLFR
jgi:hypothetical protein